MELQFLKKLNPGWGALGFLMLERVYSIDYTTKNYSLRLVPWPKG